ncbi:glycerophosphodiester phosphodiesterase family protein [Pedobacter endophyticus]|uniref:Glycerophosphodiester phosphodiesterase family protein n=1 Tax=Pedobacter endophyticus TaxID=2789740 RepID=A0A7S9PZ37_9SPHI|nr:glycerophosphodiester phosphodiesterase family protein [Pedobacter endophyticus]QPH39306.1 glycerophosphodiester phosphodiesterase family protein [Pedobacter endophyticus]
MKISHLLKAFALFAIICLSTGCSVQKLATAPQLSQTAIAEHLNWVKLQLKHPENGNILISAHRGDWRNAPENSLQSLEFGIQKGFDIIECDLKRTKDGALIIMHDKTIDRTTTGKGKPEEYTLAQLKQFKLTNATGHPTNHTIPTLEEYLISAKARAILCIDKGFEYFDQAMELVNKRDMKSQIIYNVPAITLDSLQSLQLKHLDSDLMLNILGFPTDVSKARQLSQTYIDRKNAIMHPTFKSDTIAFVKWVPTVKADGHHLWLNALWPEHNGGHDDDKAVEENKPDEAWGWLIAHGATIIQTDRPKELLQYLREKRLHR